MYMHICSTEWISSAITLNKQQTLLPYLNSDHIDCMLNKDKSINKMHDAWHASRARQPPTKFKELWFTYLPRTSFIRDYEPDDLRI